MLISDFDYVLPEDLIAQEPLASREDSRMLTVNRQKTSYRDKTFSELPGLLVKGDVLVLNNTKVFPARLLGKSETGANIEFFLIQETKKDVWEALARPGRRLKPGKRVFFGEKLSAVVLEKTAEGRCFVTFSAEGEIEDIIDQIGQTPLPPYIKRPIQRAADDRERYQTVFAKRRGAIAAPTAGLHFTPEILQKVRAVGVEIVEITLHVGYGTFEPVRVTELSEHSVKPESFEITPDAANILNEAISGSRRIIAVGTTTTRALESSVSENGRILAGAGLARTTITPGFEFRVIDGLLTNFHLPQSSLLVLVSTFGGHELIMESYRHAVSSLYRFYSYGDCMLIL